MLYNCKIFYNKVLFGLQSLKLFVKCFVFCFFFRVVVIVIVVVLLNKQNATLKICLFVSLATVN